MKNFIIVILLVFVIGENIYIYMYPESFCQKVKEKGDVILDTSSDLLEGLTSKTKDVVNSKIEEEIDSIIPTE